MYVEMVTIYIEIHTSKMQTAYFDYENTHSTLSTCYFRLRVYQP